MARPKSREETPKKCNKAICFALQHELGDLMLRCNICQNVGRVSIGQIAWKR